MPQPSVTVIDLADDATGPHAVAARVEGNAIWLEATSLRDTLGWEAKPEGLCRDDVCVPVPAGAALADDEHLDLRVLANVLRRPLALDGQEGVAVLGVSSAERSAVLATGKAPNFTLPDLNGTMHSLSDHRGKKVVVYAWASW